MYRLLALFLLSITTVNCQDFGKLEIVASFPNHLKEVSGIDLLPESDLIWVVEDSGNKTAVYGFDKNSETNKRVLSIENANNEDWEDLTTNGRSTLYIGDFGNNSNKRKDLVIYTVDSVLSNRSDKTQATKTTFTLEDQKEFPPKKKDRNFDIEAFFYLNDNFYLFSRNRSKDFDGTTKLYKLPAKEGDFTAKLIGSFKTCDDKKYCDITSAAIHKASGTVALLTYDKVFLFSDFQGDDFFNGKVRKIDLGYISQKESITLKDQNTLYIADERSGIYGGNLYELSIKN